MQTSADQSGQIQDQPKTRCNPNQQIVFIKTHKTGSTTIQTIVNRYGFFHNLSFVFNKNSSGNGHFYFLPISAEESPQKYFLPPLNVRDGDYNKYTDYDMLAIHVRYNRTALDRIMKKGTKYITIIREPSTQWESAFDQFLFQQAITNYSQVPRTKWIKTFLKKPEYHRAKLRVMPYESVKGRRWHYSQNSQMYDLGLEAHSFRHEVIINKTIDILAREFDLILVMEYFDESLLILKKEFCWNFEDIVYMPKNFRAKRNKLTKKVRRKILAWNRADVLLYNYFNRTLWRKIEEYGPGFSDDLKYFRKLNQQIFHECGNITAQPMIRGKRIHEYKEFSPKKNTTLFCHTVAENKKELFQRVYKRQKPRHNKTHLCLEEPPVENHVTTTYHNQNGQTQNSRE